MKCCDHFVGVSVNYCNVVGLPIRNIDLVGGREDRDSLGIFPDRYVSLKLIRESIDHSDVAGLLLG